jgi:hypothetical protein
MVQNSMKTTSELSRKDILIKKQNLESKHFKICFYGEVIIISWSVNRRYS